MFICPLPTVPTAQKIAYWHVARIRLRIRGLRIEKYKARLPHVQIRLGHRVFVTPKRAEAGPWDDLVEFQISLHEYLFWIIQIDVYDSRVLLPKNHLGRFELRLRKMADQRRPKTEYVQGHISVSFYYFRWHELRHRHHCYANLVDLAVRVGPMEEHVTGAICLEVYFKSFNETGSLGNEVFTHTVTSGMSPSCSDDVAPPPLRPASLPSLLPSMIKTLEAEAETMADEAAGETLNNNHSSSSGLDTPSTAGTEIDLSRDTPELFDHDQLDDLKKAEGELAVSREINSLLKKISGWFFRNDDYLVVENIINGMASFGQGIEYGSFALTIAFLLVQRFYRTLPVPFSNNIILRKEDLEMPRVIYRYAYAAHGWAGMYVFGKRHEIFSGREYIDG